MSGVSPLTPPMPPAGLEPATSRLSGRSNHFCTSFEKEWRSGTYSALHLSYGGVLLDFSSSTLALVTLTRTISPSFAPTSSSTSGGMITRRCDPTLSGVFCSLIRYHYSVIGDGYIKSYLYVIKIRSDMDMFNLCICMSQ